MAAESRPTFRLRSGEQRALLLIGDLLIGIFSLIAGIYYWFSSVNDAWFIKNIQFWPDFFQNYVLIQQPWFYLLPVAWMMLLVELYDLHRAANWRRTTRGILVATIVGMIAYMFIFFTADEPSKVNRRTVALFIALASLLTLAWRWWYIRLYTAQGSQRRVLAVGAGDNGKGLARIYKEMTPAPFHLVGFIDDDPEKIGATLDGFPILAGSDRLLELIEEMNISDVIVAITGEMRGQTFQTLLDAQEHGAEVTRMRTIYEDLLGRVPIHHLESDWVLRSFIDEARTSGFYEIGSRALDIIGSIVGLAILLIMFPILAIVMIMDDGLPIFYTQTRLGKGARVFEMIKLRTMIKNAEADGRARPAEENDPRVTKVGNFLRRTRIDELPQFWDVLRGEMSIVGPRAERPELVAKYQKQIPFYRARLMVKPGITGWAQINYGYASTIEDTEIKLEYDLYYIKNRSILMDIVIILRTISTVLSRKGR